MSYLLFKIRVIAIILFLFVGSSGCMVTPPYVQPTELRQAGTNQVQHQPVVPSFRQQQVRQQQTRQPYSQYCQNSQNPQTQQRFPIRQQQLQHQQQWAIQNASQQNGASTRWYDPLGLFDLSVPPTVQNSVNIPIVRQPSKPENLSVTAQSNPNPITQVAYQSPQPLKLQNHSNTTRQTASPELYQPWNWEAFRVKRSVSNPYRLVADTQESVPNRNVPPAVNYDRLMMLSRQTQTPNSTTTNLTATPEKNTLLHLGRDLAKEFLPSNDRKWSQNHAVLQTAEWNGNWVTVRNIRYSKYETAERYTTSYYDATFDLNDIRTIDLVVVPFRGIPRLAHVESSFGFADGRHLGMSIEARYEEGEQYDPLGAGLRQFELIYVFADERDMIRIGTDVNKNDVHIYRLKFEPNEVRAMFVDALQRANKLAEKPEFYHPLTNSCVTNLIGHINKGRPKAIPKEYRTFLPGLMDHYVYDLKLIDTTAKTFQETKENAKVNWLVEKFGDLEYFSAGIRQNMY